MPGILRWPLEFWKVCAQLHHLASERDATNSARRSAVSAMNVSSWLDFVWKIWSGDHRIIQRIWKARISVRERLRISASNYKNRSDGLIHPQMSSSVLWAQVCSSPLAFTSFSLKSQVDQRRIVERWGDCIGWDLEGGGCGLFEFLTSNLSRSIEVTKMVVWWWWSSPSSLWLSSSSSSWTTTWR